MVGGVVDTTPTVSGVINTAGQTPGDATRTLGRAVSEMQIFQLAKAAASGSNTLRRATASDDWKKARRFSPD